MTSLFPAPPKSDSSTPAWLNTRQEMARKQLDAMAMPSSSEEVWRYSRVDSIDPSKFQLRVGPSVLEAQLRARVAEVLSKFGDLSGSAVIADGRVLELNVDATNLEVERLANVGDEPSTINSNDDAFMVASDAFGEDGLVIGVDAGQTVENLFLIVNVAGGDQTMSFPRLIINVAENAKLTIVEVVISGDVEALSVPVTEVRIGDNGALDHVVIQDAGENVTLIARHTSQLSRNSKLFLSNVVVGGGYARMRTDTELAGEGAHSDLIAAYFGANNQMHDFRTLQEHVAPHTTSDLFFRGAVAGASHAVYSGLIRIRKGARGTDATQSNRTLKLSPNAVADSVPNLEIDENDVKCSHASAVGPIDDEQRYYLESRGIPVEEAERLVVLGTLDEVLARSRVKPVAEFTRALVRAKWEHKQ